MERIRQQGEREWDQRGYYFSLTFDTKGNPWLCVQMGALIMDAVIIREQYLRRLELVEHFKQAMEESSQLCLCSWQTWQQTGSFWVLSKEKSWEMQLLISPPDKGFIPGDTRVPDGQIHTGHLGYLTVTQWSPLEYQKWWDERGWTHVTEGIRWQVLFLKELGGRFCSMPSFCVHRKVFKKEVNSVGTSRLVWSCSGPTNTHSRTQFKVGGALTNQACESHSWGIGHIFHLARRYTGCENCSLMLESFSNQVWLTKKQWVLWPGACQTQGDRFPIAL